MDDNWGYPYDETEMPTLIYCNQCDLEDWLDPPSLSIHIPCFRFFDQACAGPELREVSRPCHRFRFESIVPIAIFHWYSCSTPISGCENWPSMSFKVSTISSIFNCSGELGAIRLPICPWIGSPSPSRIFVERGDMCSTRGCEGWEFPRQSVLLKQERNAAWLRTVWLRESSMSLIWQEMWWFKHAKRQKKDKKGRMFQQSMWLRIGGSLLSSSSSNSESHDFWMQANKAWAPWAIAAASNGKWTDLNQTSKSSGVPETRRRPSFLAKVVHLCPFSQPPQPEPNGLWRDPLCCGCHQCNPPR